MTAVQTKPGFLERLTNTVKSANSTNIQITWTVSGANPVTAVELTGKDGAVTQRAARRKEEA